MTSFHSINVDEINEINYFSISDDHLVIIQSRSPFLDSNVGWKLERLPRSDSLIINMIDDVNDDE